MNKWKCVMTAGITALFDGCMLRCLITGAPAQKKGKMQYIGLAVGVVLCLTGLLVGGGLYIRWQEKKLRELEAQINC